MKLYLVYELENVPYYGIANGTVEIWAAESPEQVYDMKYPNRVKEWLILSEPKIEYYGKDIEAFNRDHDKWERNKDEYIHECLEIKKLEIESYKELPHMTTDVIKPQMIFSNKII